MDVPDGEGGGMGRKPSMHLWHVGRSFQEATPGLFQDPVRCQDARGVHPTLPKDSIPCHPVWASVLPQQVNPSCDWSTIKVTCSTNRVP